MAIAAPTPGDTTNQLLQKLVGNAASAGDTINQLLAKLVAAAGQVGGGSGAWGGITGTLSAQADLQAALNLKSNVASPTFTGTPAAPTAAANTNTTQLATTAFATTAGQSAVNVKAYGAVGNGVANDTAAIAAAVAVVSAQTRPATLFFPTGIYLTDEIVLQPTSNVLKISGDGMGASIIKSRAGANIITLTGSWSALTIENISFYGNGGSGALLTHDAGLAFLFSVDIRNCEFLDAGGYGMYFPSDGVFSMKIDGCRGGNCGKDVFKVYGAAGTQFTNCYVFSAASGYAGYRVLTRATMISCNGINSGDGLWGRFGGTGDAESDGRTSYPQVNFIGCNIEDFATVGIEFKQSAAISDFDNCAFLGKTGAANLKAVEYKIGSISGKKMSFRSTEFGLKPGSSWFNSQPITNTGGSLSILSLSGSVTGFWDVPNGFTYPSTAPTTAIPNAHTYGLDTTTLGPIQLSELIAMSVGNSVFGEKANVYFFNGRPTSGTWLATDIVINTGAEFARGSASSQYTIFGWRRVTAGAGNVLNTDWVEMRCPTGT